MHTRGESYLVARSNLRFTAVTGAQHAVLGGTLRRVAPALPSIA